jgi:hypothetical protein
VRVRLYRWSIRLLPAVLPFTSMSASATANLPPILLLPIIDDGRRELIAMRLRHASSRDYLAGGGEMGALMRATDWHQTPFGPVDEWPQSLRTASFIIDRMPARQPVDVVRRNDFRLSSTLRLPRGGGVPLGGGEVDRVFAHVRWREAA